MFRYLKWLLPGIGLKRWITLGFVGVVLLSYTVILLLTRLWPSLLASFTARAYPMVIIVFLFCCSIVIILLSFKGVLKAILNVCLPKKPLPKQSEVLEKLIQQRVLKRAPKIVAIGGGTGLSALLRGLREVSSNITAIVTVADNGGSSGRLRALDIPAPGDIRNCILALATADQSMKQLFNYRFNGIDQVMPELNEHSFGNLLIATLTRITGDFSRAVKLACEILSVQGRVLPVTSCGNIQLHAELCDGSVLEGESQIGKAPCPIKRLSITPQCQTTPDVVAAILEADLIVLGPGSLYTSVIATLLPEGVISALRQTSAEVMYICNIMTQVRETLHFKASDHVEALLEYIGKDALDTVVVNTHPLPSEILEIYRQEGADCVENDLEVIKSMGLNVIAEDLLRVDEQQMIRHSSHKLAWLLARHLYAREKNDR